MILRFEGDIEGLENGIQILSEELGFSLAEDGILILVDKSEGIIEVALEDTTGMIKFNEKIHFFRALGLFIEALRENNGFLITQEPQFTMNGVMFDSSRNTVMKTESIKIMLRKMAVMGLNMMMLYTEDTYTIKDEPYFGYMRGKYTYEELKECDDYAEIFGIEIIPCIQTLAHLEQFLKWHTSAYLRDTREVLLAGSEPTYQFIEKMIKSAIAPFRSKRIHIGMDEAHGLGRGKYLDLNGHKDRFEIITNHLHRVLEITSRYNLRPMLWSDMYFRIASKTDDYYDLEADFPEKVKENMHDNVQLVYWDYYHVEEEFYQKFIRKHKELGSLPIFAGGIWSWLGMCTNYGITFATTNKALNACKKEGVKEVIATIWKDDCGENNFFSALLGMQLYAEHGYIRELDLEKLKKRVKFCTGVEYDAFMDFKYLDQIPGTLPNNEDFSNPSKFLLWQDILIGLFDKHIKGLDLASHYSWLEAKIKAHKSKSNELDFIFDVPAKLCAVLEIKSGIGVRIKEAYDMKDQDALFRIEKDELPELSKRINELRLAHRNQWFKTYKPFGWEVLDIRYGGILTRIDTVIIRLSDYLEGRVDKIEELEEERLYFDGIERIPGEGVGSYNQYCRIVSANLFSFSIGF